MSNRAEAIFDFIIGYKMAHDGNSPSFRQISEALGFSLSIIDRYLNELEETGLILRDKFQARQICIVGGHWEWQENSPGE
jgi:SOS-response transcriptional repressor LexA